MTDSQPLPSTITPGAAEANRVFTEGGGLLSLSIIRLENARSLYVEIRYGEPQLRFKFEMAANAVRLCREAPADALSRCVACDKPLRSPAVVILALPDCDAPTGGMAVLACRACAHEDLQAHAIDALKDYWPALRTVEITHYAGGRA